MLEFKGGTEFICGVAGGDGRLIKKEVFPTTMPGHIIEKISNYFSGIKKEYDDEQDM